MYHTKVYNYGGTVKRIRPELIINNGQSTIIVRGLRKYMVLYYIIILYKPRIPKLFYSTANSILYYILTHKEHIIRRHKKGKGQSILPFGVNQKT